MPPKIVATPKYFRVPIANLPSAVSTGSRPARTRTMRSRNLAPSSARKISSVMTKSSEVRMLPATESRPVTAETMVVSLTLDSAACTLSRLTPMLESQLVSPESCSEICAEYCGRIEANCAAPMIAATTMPIRIV